MQETKRRLVLPSLIVAGALALTLTACSTPSIKDADSKPVAAAEEPIAEPTEEPEPEPVVEEGSLESPYPLGHEGSLYEGSEDNVLATFSVAIKDADADAAIAKANQFNDAAQKGYHYVAVEYTFTGQSADEPLNVSMTLYDWSLAQEDGTLISESNTSVVMPDGWNATYDVNDLYKGQTGTAVVVYQVPDGYAGTLFSTAYGKYITL